MTAQQPKAPIRATTPPAAAQPGFFTRHSVPRLAPFAAYMTFIAVADLLHRFGWTAQELLWLYPVKIVAVIALLLYFRRSYTELLQTKPTLRQSALAIAAGAVVFVLWINLDAAWMQIGAAAGYDPAGDGGRIDWGLTGSRVVGAALVVPVMEELFWRSFVQRWLARADFLGVQPAAVGIRALLIASALFAIEHNLWFAGLVAGLVYGLLYMRAGTLWSPVIAHAVTNGMLAVWVLTTGSWTYW